MKAFSEMSHSKDRKTMGDHVPDSKDRKTMGDHVSNSKDGKPMGDFVSNSKDGKTKGNHVPLSRNKSKISETKSNSSKAAPTSNETKDATKNDITKKGQKRKEDTKQTPKFNDSRGDEMNKGKGHKTFQVHNKDKMNERHRQTLRTKESKSSNTEQLTEYDTTCQSPDSYSGQHKSTERNQSADITESKYDQAGDTHVSKGDKTLSFKSRKLSPETKTANKSLSSDNKRNKNGEALDKKGGNQPGSHKVKGEKQRSAEINSNKNEQLVDPKGRNPSVVTSKGCCKSSKPLLEKEEDKDADEYLERYYKIISNQDVSTVTKEFLTEEIVNQYKGSQSKYDISLARCIENNATDESINFPHIYHESNVTDYKDFFLPLISNVHATSCHKIDKAIESPINFLRKLYDHKSMIASVDFEMVRNISGYCMGESLKGEEATKLADILVNCLKGANIGGRFVSYADQCSFNNLLHNGIRIAKTSDLPNLMKNLEPQTSRGVFYGTEPHNLSIAINFGDHIRISSTGNSFSAANEGLRSVYMCLNRIKLSISQNKDTENNFIITEPNEDMKAFAMDNTFGFITYNPLEIGTGFHIRILLRIPYLRSLNNFEDVVKDIVPDLRVSYLNDAFKDSPDEPFVYFSNTKTFGMTVSDVIEDFILNIGDVIRMEKEMKAMNTKPGILITEPVEYLKTKIDNKKSLSYTRKYLTKSVTQQYKNLETSYGGRLSHCIRGNAHSEQALFPRACDQEAYVLFRGIFEPILKEFNGIDRLDHYDSNLLSADLENIKSFSHDKILSYRVRIARNLDGFPFPLLMNSMDRKMTELKLTMCLSALKDEYIGKYYPLKNFDTSLVNDERLIMKETSKRAGNNGLHRDWPKGRGMFVFNQIASSETIAWINEEDHFRLISINPTGSSIIEPLTHCVNIIRQLENSFNGLFCKDSRFGYLTGCPSETGSGLRISAFVKVNVLHQPSQMDTLHKICQDNCLQIRGTTGTHSKIEDGILDVSLKCRIGCTETEQVHRFLNGLQAIIDADH